MGTRTIKISIAVGAIVGLIGCGEQASNLTATLGTTVLGTYTPAALPSGTAAVATTSTTASFDNVVYAQP